jgi:hypothetical protein
MTTYAYRIDAYYLQIKTKSPVRIGDTVFFQVESMCGFDWAIAAVESVQGESVYIEITNFVDYNVSASDLIKLGYIMAEKQPDLKEYYFEFNGQKYTFELEKGEEPAWKKIYVVDSDGELQTFDLISANGNQAEVSHNGVAGVSKKLLDRRGFYQALPTS